MVCCRIPLLAERISRMLESLEQDREFETPPAVHPLTFTAASAASPLPDRVTPSSHNVQVHAAGKFGLLSCFPCLSVIWQDQ